MAFNATEEFLALAETIAGIEEAASTISGTSDEMWNIIAGFLVFFMHAGFSMLEAGSVRHKNAVNILFKNIGTISIGGIAYFFTGYGLAYGAGEDGGSFAGLGNMAYDTIGEDGGVPDSFFFFQFTFAATAATIVSGAVAGRISLGAYFLIAALLTGLIYPVVTHWVWASTGWNSAFAYSNLGDAEEGLPAIQEYLFLSDVDGKFGCGMIDYAGSGVVHLTGGVAALITAKILGPRLGRFDADGTPVDLPAHNVALQALGTFILWFGWYGFNCGSTLLWDGTNASHVAVTTTLSPSAAVLTVMFFKKLTSGYWDITATLNGALAGLVSITGPCSTVSPFSSIIIGIIGAFVYMGSSKLMLKMGVDDPVDAISVHGSCGIWGVVAVAIFADQEIIASAYSIFGGNECDRGLLFGNNVVGVLAIIGWVTLTLTPIVIVLKVTGFLRVSAEHEEAGLDASEHGSSAFVSDKSAKLAPESA